MVKPAGYYGTDLTLGTQSSRLLDPADVLRDHGHRLVRCVLKRDDDLTEALLDLAAGKQANWTPAQWDALLTELGKSDEIVEDWLVLNS